MAAGDEWKARRRVFEMDWFEALMERERERRGEDEDKVEDREGEEEEEEERRMEDASEEKGRGVDSKVGQRARRGMFARFACLVRYRVTVTVWLCVVWYYILKQCQHPHHSLTRQLDVDPMEINNASKIQQIQQIEQ